MSLKSKLGIAALGALALGGATIAAQHTATPDTLRDVDAFAQITETQARSTALFEEMGKVLQHPRCLNCHPVDSSPRQGMEMALHNPPVTRGEDGHGTPAMKCSTCHQKENVAYLTKSGSIPGHEPWHLAPASMGWIGKNLGEICEQLKDPARNGERTLAQIHEHNAKDGLVGWAWTPGEGREPAPGTQEIFGALTKAWIDTGAHCPGGS